MTRSRTILVVGSLLIGAAVLVSPRVGENLPFSSAPSDAAPPPEILLAAPTVTPPVITLGSSTEVLFQTTVPDSTISEIRLQVFDPTSNSWRFVGELRDDGLKEDPTKRDRTFNLLVALAERGGTADIKTRAAPRRRLSSAVPLQLRLAAKKARVGRLVISPHIVIDAWPRLAQETLGTSLNYPPDWVVRDTSGTITLSDAAIFQPLSESALEAQAFFQLALLTSDPGVATPSHANPDLLPINQWFDQYFAQGFPVTPQSRTSLVLNGHPAIRLEIVEVGGLRAHVYISNGPDVIEVSYGLFTPRFIPHYETMLNSIVFIN